MRAAPTILSAAVAGLLLACSDSTEPSSTTPDFQGPAEPAFQVTPATATLQPGQTLQLGTRYSGNSAFLIACLLRGDGSGIISAGLASRNFRDYAPWQLLSLPWTTSSSRGGASASTC